MNVQIQSEDQAYKVTLPFTVLGAKTALHDRDIRGELTINPDPTNPREWWVRALNQIDTLTFHHTLSDSPHVTFRTYIHRKKRPTGPYTFWITQEGQVLLCVNPELGVYHDHTGFWVSQGGRKLWGNRHLSVGLAGRLHEYTPAQVQLDAAARFATNVIKSTEYSGIASIQDIKGHMDMTGTECPGWVVVRNGRQCEDRWKARFYEMIHNAI